MKTSKTVSVILAATLLAGMLPAPVYADASFDWKLVWSDEFDGNSVDSSKWSYDIGNWKTDDKGNLIAYGWGNNEKQYYTDKNTVVSDGTLTIQAKKENYTDSVQGNYDYTSSKLITKGNFSTTYGKIEVRAKIDSGASLWPAIWMLPEDEAYGGWAASGEIDIMESWGSNPQKIAGTIHFGDVWPNNRYLTSEYTFPDSSICDWHKYSVEWQSGEIRWYVDDVLYGKQTDWSTSGRTYPAPFDQNFYIILNMAVGGHFDGVGADGMQAEPGIFADGSKDMEIDYVRVYAKDGIKGTPSEVISPPLKLYTMEQGEAALTNSDNGTRIDITSTGNQPYSVMAAKEGIDFKAGRTYDIKMYISPERARDIEITLEDSEYTRYFDKIYPINFFDGNISFQYTPTADQRLDLKIMLGNINGASGVYSLNIFGIDISDTSKSDNVLYGDINLDGKVTSSDLVPFIKHFLTAPLNDAQRKNADLNLDGNIALTDLATLKQYLIGDTVSMGGKSASIKK